MRSSKHRRILTTFPAWIRIGDSRKNPLCLHVRNRGRCTGRCGGGKMGSAFVRDADRTVMLLRSWSQDGVGGRRQELSIVAVSTRTRLFGPVVPPDGRV